HNPCVLGGGAKGTGGPPPQVVIPPPRNNKGGPTGGWGGGGPKVVLPPPPPPPAPTIVVPPPQTIGVTQTSAIVGAGQSGPIPVSVSASNAAPTDTFVVTLSDNVGMLSVNGGAGATTLTISGTLSQVNAALGTLTDTNTTPGTDNITVTATGSSGSAATPATISVTVNGLPQTILTTPPIVGVNQTTAIPEISIAESGNTS